MTKVQAFGLACYAREPGADQIAMQDEIRADLAALAAAPAAAPAWQPIETAPKSGREILAYAEDFGAVVVYWDDWQEPHCWGTGFDVSVTPAHWMPLPAAPEIPCAATVAPAPAPAAPELVYSSNEEDFTHDYCSVIDSIRSDWGDDKALGMAYWFGEKFEAPPSHYFKGIADSVIETAQSWAWDNHGEYADDFLDDVSDEARAELNDVIGAWADKHITVNFWTVINVRKLAITEEDLGIQAPGAVPGVAQS